MCQVNADEATVELVARVIHHNGEWESDPAWRLTPDTCETCSDSLRTARGVVAALTAEERS